MTDLAALVVRMQADNSAYIKALDQATQRLTSFSSEINGLLEDIAEKFAAAFTIDAIIEFGVNTLEAAASLDKLSQAAGISVEQLSQLRVAAVAGGSSQDVMATSLKKLNTAISEAGGDPTSKAAYAFEALGISVKNADGSLKSAGQIVPEIADKFKNLADGPNKVAITTDLLGRSAQSLIPVLNGGSAALADYAKQADDAGLTMSSGLAKAADELSTKFELLKLSFTQGFGNEALAAAIPSLNAFADGLKSIAAAGKDSSGVFSVLVSAIQAIGVVLLEADTEFKSLGSAATGAGQALKAAASGNFSDAWAILNKQSADSLAIREAGNAAMTRLIQQGGKEQTAAQIAASASVAAAAAAAAPPVSAGVSPAQVQQQADAAKKVTTFSDALKASAESMNQGAVAETNYKLATGELGIALALAKSNLAGMAAGTIPLNTALKASAQATLAAAAAARVYAAEKQTKEDTKTITEFTSKLQEQVTKFEQGDVAAIKYQETTGKLGDALKRSADGGASATAQINALALSLVRAKDQNALFAIDQQTLTLSGHLAQAAAAAFDFQNKILIKNVTDTGDAAGAAKLANLKNLEVEQGKFNELVQQAAIINQQLATVEASVALAQSQGAVSDLAAQSQINAARQAALVQLNAIYAAEGQIASQNATTLPKLTQDTQAFGNQLKQLQGQTNQLEQSVRAGLESSFANNFADLITGAESFRKAIANMAKDIEKQFADIIAKNFAQNIFGQGGSAGGLAGMLAGLLGGGGSNYGVSNAVIPGVVQNSGVGGGIGNIVGGFASGGTIPAGQAGIVGENGPELAYSGTANMNIVPMSSKGAPQIHVVNNFPSSPSGGKISRQSMMQQAAMAARSLQQASRRNNT